MSRKNPHTHCRRLRWCRHAHGHVDDGRDRLWSSATAVIVGQRLSAVAPVALRRATTAAFIHAAIDWRRTSAAVWWLELQFVGRVRRWVPFSSVGVMTFVCTACFLCVFLWNFPDEQNTFSSLIGYNPQRYWRSWMIMMQSCNDAIMQLHYDSTFFMREFVSVRIVCYLPVDRLSWLYSWYIYVYSCLDSYLQICLFVDILLTQDNCL